MPLSEELNGDVVVVAEKDESSHKNKKKEQVNVLSSSSSSVTQFLFITRHPIANALAHQALIAHVSFETLMKNYIQLHKYMLHDEKHLLQSPVMWLKLEDFTQNPKKYLKQVWDFAQKTTTTMPPTPSNKNDNDYIIRSIDAVLKKRTIHPNPNGKYIKQWCGDGDNNNNDGLNQTYHSLIQKYNPEIKKLGLGYDLENFCN